jgi:hypothetical protein
VELVDIDRLAAAVSERAADEPLDRVGAALAVCDELAAGADQLINRFVTAAREAGCSWTEIGERIGVSKQAARQRYVQRPPGATTAPPRGSRLQACLDAAGREAAADGAAEVGTHHQLIGLFHEGTGAAVLERQGIQDTAAPRSIPTRSVWSQPRSPAGQPPARRPPARPTPLISFSPQSLSGLRGSPRSTAGSASRFDPVVVAASRPQSSKPTMSIYLQARE